MFGTISGLFLPCFRFQLCWIILSVLFFSCCKNAWNVTLRAFGYFLSHMTWCIVTWQYHMIMWWGHLTFTLTKRTCFVLIPCVAPIQNSSSTRNGPNSVHSCSWDNVAWSHVCMIVVVSMSVFDVALWPNWLDLLVCLTDRWRWRPVGICGIKIWWETWVRTVSRNGWRRRSLSLCSTPGKCIAWSEMLGCFVLNNPRASLTLKSHFVCCFFFP